MIPLAWAQGTSDHPCKVTQSETKEGDQVPASVTSGPSSHRQKDPFRCSFMASLQKSLMSLSKYEANVNDLWLGCTRLDVHLKRWRRVMDHRHPTTRLLFAKLLKIYPIITWCSQNILEKCILNGFLLNIEWKVFQEGTWTSWTSRSAWFYFCQNHFRWKWNLKWNLICLVKWLILSCSDQTWMSC